MDNGITNDLTFFFQRTLPNFTDLLTQNQKIENLVLDKTNNTLEITTLENHELQVNEYVFTSNVLYGYNIKAIKSEVLEWKYLDRLFLKISIQGFLTIAEGTEIDLKNITTNPLLNGKFIVYKTEIIDDESIFYGLLKDTQIVISNIDITNEGYVAFSFIDDMFNTDEIKSTTGFATTRISGTYNGLKIVSEVVNEKTFKINLFTGDNILQPEYSDVIDFQDGYLKKNFQVFGVDDINEEIKLNCITRYTGNEITGTLLITRQENEASLYGTSISNQTINSRSGVDLTDEQINFSCSLVFRVERKDANHYILAKQSNQVADFFTRLLKSLTNRFYFEEKIYFSNEATADVLYKSYWGGSTRTSNIGNTENSVFKSIDFNFKTTRQQMGYNTFEVNKINIPIRSVKVNIDYFENDFKNIEID